MNYNKEEKTINRNKRQLNEINEEFQSINEIQNEEINNYSDKDNSQSIYRRK